MKTFSPIKMFKEVGGYSKKTYTPKMENIVKLRLFLKKQTKNG